MDSSQKHSKTKTIWLLVILFLFALSNTVWGLFALQLNNEREQEMKNASSLAIQKISLESKLKTTEATESDIQQETTDTKWREIPELGIRYKVIDNTKNITYAYSEDEGGRKIIGLSTVELTSAAPANAKRLSSNEAYQGDKPCTSQDPMAVIESSNTTFSDGFGEGKKVGASYYRLSFGKLNGSTKCSQDMLTVLQQRSQALYDSIQPIDS